MDSSRSPQKGIPIMWLAMGVVAAILVGGVTAAGLELQRQRLESPPDPLPPRRTDERKLATFHAGSDSGVSGPAAVGGPPSDASLLDGATLKRQLQTAVEKRRQLDAMIPLLEQLSEIAQISSGSGLFSAPATQIKLEGEGSPHAQSSGWAPLSPSGTRASGDHGPGNKPLISDPRQGSPGPFSSQRSSSSEEKRDVHWDTIVVAAVTSVFTFAGVLVTAMFSRKT